MLEVLIWGFFIGVAGVLLYFIPKLLSTRLVLERSIRIERPQEAVQAYLDNFENLDAWHPWFNADPAATSTLAYRDPSPETIRTLGNQRVSTYRWEGNALAGEGIIELLANRPGHITYRLVFLRHSYEAFPKETTSDLLIEAEGIQTKLIWRFSTEINSNVGISMRGYLREVIQGYVNASFDQGLARIKRAVEGR
jgi:hypothetical protein